jgi:endonuclease III
MVLMREKVQKILEIWHKHFSKEEKQYVGFEDSDIEYFVGCMLYNHFSFSKALQTMKTIDLSYDFLSACGDEYDEITAMIKTIGFNTEKEKLEFLQEFIKESIAKYSKDELYLLNRLKKHIDLMAERYEKDTEAKRVVFKRPIKNKNPLLR